ncbi:hypothetical protein PBR20603_01530 [Pandoraea bronchicola]|uniref:Uncharacterized protein n=1 Tax=Pandoraea bronchicola TaxID=2508287 RepID=A0A5E5BPL2_9BURK|nr:hypothetical protein PBR20603_01530 [Pandoraea bronchicola]
MTLDTISGSNPVPPFARWPRAGDARTIGLHALAFPGRSRGAPFLPCSRGEHAGTY